MPARIVLINYFKSLFLNLMHKIVKLLRMHFVTVETYSSMVGARACFAAGGGGGVSLDSMLAGRWWRLSRLPQQPATFALCRCVLGVVTVLEGWRPVAGARRLEGCRNRA